MKKFLSLFAAAMLLCTSCAVAAEPMFADGVYTSIMQTDESQMTVTVTLDENLIKGISLTADEETVDVTAPEVTQLLQTVVSGQTLAVDVDSPECTGVCRVILCGVEDCVRQAGGDVECLRTHHLCQSQHGYHHVSSCASHASGSHHGSSSGHHSGGSSHHSSQKNSGGHHGGSSGHDKGHH